jgi:hypothetical protein
MQAIIDFAEKLLKTDPKVREGIQLEVVHNELNCGLKSVYQPLK